MFALCIHDPCCPLATEQTTSNAFMKKAIVFENLVARSLAVNAPQLRHNVFGHHWLRPSVLFSTSAKSSQGPVGAVAFSSACLTQHLNTKATSIMNTVASHITCKQIAGESFLASLKGV